MANKSGTGKWFAVDESLPTINDDLYNEGYEMRGVPVILSEREFTVAWFNVEDQRFYDACTFPYNDITDRVRYWFDIPNAPDAPDCSN